MSPLIFLSRWLSALFMASLATVVLADSDVLNIPLSKTYQNECSSCHLAFPPVFLHPNDWRTMMGALDKHFGTDASLEAPLQKEILDFVLKVSQNSKNFKKGRLAQASTNLGDFGANLNASNNSNNPNHLPRITSTQWFVRKHDGREIPASIWNHPSVKTPANCAACHTQADKGNYDERTIALPR